MQRAWWDVRMPHDASLDGWRIDEMIETTTFFVVLMLVITLGILGWAVVRHGKHHKARFDHGASWTSWRWTVLTAALVFLVVDGDLLVRSFRAVNGVYLNFAAAEATPDAVRVEVNAHQWAWAYRYAGPDGRFNTADDIVGLNQLVLPQGRPVIFELVSTDVIHAFNVPNMRMKVDVVPGQVNRMWFTPKETGVFEIACAQHCGANHYKMRGEIRVVPSADYDTWAQAASANSARAYDAADAEAHWGWPWSGLKRNP